MIVVAPQATVHSIYGPSQLYRNVWMSGIGTLTWIFFDSNANTVANQKKLTTITKKKELTRKVKIININMLCRKSFAWYSICIFHC